MTEDGYLYAWLIYLACSIGLLLCFWWMTKPLYQWLKQPLRAMGVAFLLMPWTAAKDIDSLSPAWLATFFDGLLKQDINSGRAGLPLLLAMLLALVISLISLYFHYRKQRQQDAPAEA